VRVNHIFFKVNSIEWAYILFLTLIPCVYSLELLDPSLLPRNAYLAIFNILLTIFAIRFGKTLKLTWPLLLSIGIVSISFSSIFWSYNSVEALFTSLRYCNLALLIFYTTQFYQNKQLKVKYVYLGMMLAILGFIML